MKRIVMIVSLLIAGISVDAQELMGAWEKIEPADSGKKIRNVLVYTDDFYSLARFDAESGEFVGTRGGICEIQDNAVKHTLEYNTENSSQVGGSVSYTFEMDGNKLKSSYGEWTRIDDGKPGNLQGAWLMSGRIRDGEVQERDTDRPRKTMKILSGTRFQWIAYNTETKQFMGTGGGTYTTKDGKYTENIEFFSRDDSRVGAALEFNYEMKDGRWHHSGNNSRGEPMYELWSVRK